MSRLADRIRRLQPSPIRDILHVIDQPGMISFAGGLPSQETFVELETESIHSSVLQYGASEGDLSLRELIAEELTSRGLQTDASRVLVLSGSQQGIDLVGKLMVQPGRTVAVESPTYLAALQVFTLFGADYQTFTAESLLRIDDAVDLAYVNPTFQNPTGYCYTPIQRQSLAERCSTSSCVLFEDDPYRDLNYQNCDTRPACCWVQNGEWIYQSSFSKSFAPGLRLGYLTASTGLFDELVKLKQAADLHSNRLSQYLVAQMLSTNQHNERRPKLIAHYRKRRDQFNELLMQEFNQLADWQVPAGGLFFWLQLAEDINIDTGDLLQQAIEQKVAFMPGEPFFASDPPASSVLRLNFSHADPESAAIGLRRLAKLIRATA